MALRSNQIPRGLAVALTATLLVAACSHRPEPISPTDVEPDPRVKGHETVRFATFNASLRI